MFRGCIRFHMITYISTFFFFLANNGTWNPHQVELALWTHYVASEMKPELLNTIPNPTENGTSHHDQKNGDSTPKPQVLQHS